jgi:hypothetical protein
MYSFNLVSTVLAVMTPKTAKELKKLVAESTDHSHGHPKAIDGFPERVSELEKRVRALERGKS